MPEKPATVAAYAAGASLAAITLFYVFGPNYTIDGEESSDNGRKKGIVGLSNPANDCFINSVLQALAGLGELRVYLIRELHRRQIDRPEIYECLPDIQDVRKGDSLEKIRELQMATVTKALKEMLDRLNERPIYKKTISAREFIVSLECAFRTRINRTQQDAQEFLQIVAERLCDEYHAGLNARRRFLSQDEKRFLNGVGKLGEEEDDDNDAETQLGEDDSGFPFEGKLESQVECQFCRYKYKPNATSFVNLTLQVPQKSSATLSSCFDNLFKTEYIEDFRCDNCQLLHALEVKRAMVNKTKSEKQAKHLEKEIFLIEEALRNDPETPPEGVNLPDASEAPRRKIARHMRITVFPKITAIHLSRSIFDPISSTKNAAKISFPERLPLGGILDRKMYKLLGIVCHKGSHNSGHYESFRRNNLYPPFSTPDAFRTYAQSRAGSQNPSAVPSPRLNPSSYRPAGPEPSPLNITPPSSTSSASVSATSLPLNSSRAPSTSTGTSQLTPPLTTPQSATSTTTTEPSLSRSSSSRNTPRVTISRNPSTSLEREKSTKSNKQAAANGNDGSGEQSFWSSSATTATTAATSRFRRKKHPNERWWRISDEKIKECKTNDVLGMQKEVYLLFYELERPGSG